MSKYEFPSENNAVYNLSSHPTNLSVTLKFLGEFSFFTNNLRCLAPRPRAWYIFLFVPAALSKKIRYFYKKSLGIIRRSVKYFLDRITSRVALITLNEFGAFSENSVTTYFVPSKTIFICCLNCIMYFFSKICQNTCYIDCKT